MEEVKDFGWALDQIKADKAVFRTGWNGRGMCIFLIRGRSIEYNTFMSFKNNATQAFDPPKDVIIRDHIDMKAADGTYVTGWAPSSVDVLAEDWKIFL